MKTQYYKVCGLASCNMVSVGDMILRRIDANMSDEIVGFVEHVYENSINIILWEPFELSSTNILNLSEVVSDDNVANMTCEMLSTKPYNMASWLNMAEAVANNHGKGGHIDTNINDTFMLRYDVGDGFFINLLSSVKLSDS